MYRPDGKALRWRIYERDPQFAEQLAMLIRQSLSGPLQVVVHVGRASRPFDDALSGFLFEGTDTEIECVLFDPEFGDYTGAQLEAFCAKGVAAGMRLIVHTADMRAEAWFSGLSDPAVRRALRLCNKTAGPDVLRKALIEFSLQD